MQRRVSTIDDVKTFFTFFFILVKFFYVFQRFVLLSKRFYIFQKKRWQSSERQAD